MGSASGSLTKAGCPTSRSFFARCGIPLHLPSDCKFTRYTQRSTVAPHLPRNERAVGYPAFVREPGHTTRLLLERSRLFPQPVYSPGSGSTNQVACTTYLIRPRLGQPQSAHAARSAPGAEVWLCSCCSRDPYRCNPVNRQARTSVYWGEKG